MQLTEKIKSALMIEAEKQMPIAIREVSSIMSLPQLATSCILLLAYLSTIYCFLPYSTHCLLSAFFYFGTAYYCSLPCY